jgi:hypothetical protein
MGSSESRPGPAGGALGAGLARDRGRAAARPRPDPWLDRQNGIYSADLAQWHVDLNAAASRLGRVDPGTGRGESLFVAASSRSLGERWNAGAELSASRRRGEEGMRQLMVAAS